MTSHVVFFNQLTENGYTRSGYAVVEAENSQLALMKAINGIPSVRGVEVRGEVEYSIKEF